MNIIWVKFKANEPADNLKVREDKENRVREILKAKIQNLQDAIAQGRLESATSARYELDDLSIRECWKIYIEGEGSVEEFATSLHNEIANILSKDEFDVTAHEDPLPIPKQN